MRCEIGVQGQQQDASSSSSTAKGCVGAGRGLRILREFWSKGFPTVPPALRTMRTKCLSLLLALSISLAAPGLEAQNAGGPCPLCPANALCHNHTHCVCMNGFQSHSGRKYFMGTKDKCEDIDECKTGQARCKEVSYCRNKIGSYICSCLLSSILPWIASIINFDRPECYGVGAELITAMGIGWESESKEGEERPAFTLVPYLGLVWDSLLLTAVTLALVIISVCTPYRFMSPPESQVSWPPKVQL